MLAAVLTAAALIWTTLLVGAPFVAASGRFPWLTLFVFQAGALICHQRPERSFHLAGVQMPVCARCFGLYAAGAAGLLLAWWLRQRWSTATTRVLLAAAAVPIAISVALEWVGAIATTNLFRALTGLPLGLAAGVVIVDLLRGSPAHRSAASE